MPCLPYHLHHLPPPLIPASLPSLLLQAALCCCNFPSSLLLSTSLTYTYHFHCGTMPQSQAVCRTQEGRGIRDAPTYCYTFFCRTLPTRTPHRLYTTTRAIPLPHLHACHVPRLPSCSHCPATGFIWAPTTYHHTTTCLHTPLLPVLHSSPVETRGLPSVVSATVRYYLLYRGWFLLLGLFRHTGPLYDCSPP